MASRREKTKPFTPPQFPIKILQVLKKAITMPDDTKSKEQAQDLARRIIAGVQTPFSIVGVSIEIGASIGVASYPADAQTPEGILKAANKEMYTDKAGHQLFG